MESEEIQRILEDHERRIKFLELPNISCPSIQKKQSLREFVNEHKCDSDVDRTLLILYYKEKSEDIKEINSKEIAQGFKEIKEKVPSNIPDKFQQLLKKGFIDSSEGEGKFNSWTYTNSGEKYIESIKI